MSGLEITAQVHANHSGQSVTDTHQKKEGIFCDGQYLHRKPKFGARRPVEENI